MSLEQRLEEFFSIAINYFGFEIALPLNQHFSINQFFNDDEEDATYSFRIQYGYPQTGCIIMDSTYVLDEDEYYIEEYNSLTEFAQHENISYSTASNWINGRSPVPYNIRRIYYKNNIEKKYERK